MVLTKNFLHVPRLVWWEGTLLCVQSTIKGSGRRVSFRIDMLLPLFCRRIMSHKQMLSG